MASKRTLDALRTQHAEVRDHIDIITMHIPMPECPPVREADPGQYDVIYGDSYV